jgi:hypothetical protein
MKKAAKVGETPATRFLRSRGIEYTEHVYDYVDHGGTAESARQLGVPEHEIVKTLVMQTDRGDPFIVLMHGDRSVVTASWRARSASSRCSPARRPMPNATPATWSAGPRRSEPARRCRSMWKRASRPAARSDQRRPARLPGRHRARRARHAARRHAGALRVVTARRAGAE